MAGAQLQGQDGKIIQTVKYTSDLTPKLALKNALANSSSPYLRSHKDNLVAWQEWSPETITLAKIHERPIFLSIGYSACHWCHVMSHESFDSPDIGAAINNAFIPIKVDRESRPDLDDIYMNYVTATTGSGGWPLNVFLTPDLQPLFGGTYWPSPSSETTLPRSGDAAEDKPLNFLDIVLKIRDIWLNERQKCLASAADITHQLKAFAAEGIHGNDSVHIRSDENENDVPEPLDLDLIDDALAHFISRYDSKYGGFTSAAGPNGPKFPTPANLTFLLRIGASITRPSTHTRFGFPSPVPGIVGRKSCATAASMGLHTLQSMSRSALRDHLGNGFHRYSVTPDWNLPHFEKMLHDNAQLLGVYCDTWALAKDPEILGTIYDLVEYLTSPDSPIVRKDGGWYASEAADSLPSPATIGTTHQQPKEGAYYVWTIKAIQSVLGERDSNIVAHHFGVQEHGNIAKELDVKDEFINQNVLYVDATPSILAKKFGLKDDEVVKVIKEGKRKLLEYRASQRARPEVDDKIILSWNALAISALARAANTLAPIDEARARVSREAAVKAAAFIKANMYNSSTGKLTRIYSENSTSSNTNQPHGLAFLDDYAYMIHSLRTLFDLTFERHYLDWSLQLQDTLDRDFSGGQNDGYYQSATAPQTNRKDIFSSNPSLTKPIESPPEAANNDLEIQEQILDLKPGTDNDLPSPNGVIAANLVYLSAYASSLSSNASSPTTSLNQSSKSLLQKARSTINAFAPEIIQHPFLYVSLLSAVVLDTVGVKALLIPSVSAMDDATFESKELRGFGRTVVRLDGVKTGEILICETGNEDGVCRVLRDGELDELDDAFEDEKAVPEVSVEVIERREEMARRESLAIEMERRNTLTGTPEGRLGAGGVLPEVAES